MSLSAEELLAQGSRLINQRHFGLAVKAFTTATQLSPDNPHGWMGLAIACQLRNDQLGAEEAWQRASQCPSYSDVMKGDMLRDRARAAMSQGALDVAEGFLWDAALLHANDPNRMACIAGMWGRWHLAQGNPALSLQAHLNAHLAWSGLGVEADPQWVYNNLLPMTQAAMALSAQTLHDVLGAKGAQRTWKHIALGLTTVGLPFIGWRIARRLRR